LSLIESLALIRFAFGLNVTNPRITSGVKLKAQLANNSNIKKIIIGDKCRKDQVDF